MLKRPTAGESDDDLLQQEQELMARGEFQPSAKLISVNKRKTEEPVSPKSSDTGAATPRSKFAQDRAAKKKKEGIVDNTVLTEVVSQKEKVPVLGRIVERVVPAGHSLQEWHPTPSPHGFPKAQRLQNLKGTVSNSGPGTKKKSIYLQNLEKKGLIVKEECFKSVPISSEGSPVTAHASQDPRLSALGKQSCVITGDGIQQNKSEMDKIHQQNIGKLASMTHEERMKEKQELFSNLTSEQITLLQSFRQRKEMAQKDSASRASDKKSSDQSNLAVDNEKKTAQSTPMECEDLQRSEEGRPSSSDAPSSSEPMHEGDSVDVKTRSVKFSSDVEMKEVADNEENLELELPIPPSEARKWLHMDKVDMEKLQWMTNMPKPKPLKDSEGFVARFNFEGDILPYDADVSYREGLHHHGEEPGRAGYTLDELFILIRSQVLQQRHLGLRTLANILRNAKEGLYDTCVNPSVVQLTVEAGAVLLLRFALDDSSHLVYSEAVRGLYYLIASEPDEQCLALAQPWLPAGLEPGISSDIHASEKIRQELDQEEAELKDFEIIKLDIIRALVRMDTHIRLRYLLEIIKPGPETVINIMGIFLRMVRHSLTAAWTLIRTPRLISTIMTNFLPHNLSPLLTGETVDSMTSVYGIPLRHALRLLTILATKGRQLAAVLVNTHNIMSHVLTYVSLEPSEVSIPLQEALALSQEAYRMWAVLLTYGLSKSQEAVASFYPLLVKQLVFYRDKVSVNEETDKNKFNYDVGAHMIAALTAAVNVAATHSLLENRMKLNQGTVIGADGKAEVLVPPELTWDDLKDLPQLVETCLTKWLAQLTRSNEATFSALRLIGSCCNFLEAYYCKWKDQTSYSGDVHNKKIQHLHNNIISPILISPYFKTLIASLPSHSSLISDLVPGTERDPNNLGSAGCVTFGGEVVPVLRPSSPHPMLLPITNLLVSLHTLHPALNAHALCELLDSDEISVYLKKVCQSSHQLSSQWLTRIETYFICNLLQLAALKGCSRRQLYHETAMCMMACVHKGDEHIIKELLTNVICAKEFISDLTEMSTHVGDLSLNNYEPLKSPAITQPVLSPLQLTESICQSLKSIERELIRSLVSKREYDASVVLKNGIPFIINGVTISQTESPLVLDSYWSLNPIKYVFKVSQRPPQPQEQKAAGHSSDLSTPEDILTVTRCLQMAYLTLKHRKTTIHTTTTTTWMYHLSLVFLVACDMFLDACISSNLQGCVVELLGSEGYSKLDPSSTIEGFTSFTDWYRNMLEQFISVSYGDSTFALFLLIPLQQYWSVDFRMLLWGDKSDALQFFRLTVEQVDQFIPLQQFMEPAEQDEGMIIKYRSAIGSGAVSAARTPFLHRVATHHTSLYLQRQADKQRNSA
ncbi:RNA polymerase II-associated protein 1-like [Homarus americanus]|uniref:RNA polymerase II-associated protein 1-like n=1 Tax=Homarus americanus TaxID=6706 RepID=UPI001C48AF86|nr:RNA polymerase II-associated protein 1-like [Homarus americanus]